MSKSWDDFRSQMPVTERWAYFDHAAVAPLSLPALLALSEWGHMVAANGDAQAAEVRRRLDKVRQTSAKLLGCSTDEVAFVPNTTSGLSIVAEAFPWRDGDNVIVPASEFPSNILPWRELIPRGVEVRAVPCDAEVCLPERLLAAVDSRTRLMSVSWVGYATGWRQDLDRLADECHRRGVLLCVDAIQGLGVIPLDVSQTRIDFLSADGHKWLLGPEGAGLLYVRKEHLDVLRPLGLGWHSERVPGRFANADSTASENDVPFRVLPPFQPGELSDSASRFEGGSANVGGVLALGASLDLLLDWGIPNVWSRLADITQRVREVVVEAGGRLVSSDAPRHRSGIVSFELPHRPTDQLRPFALQRGVVVNRRRGFTRVSPHVYTNDEDLERLRSVLLEFASHTAATSTSKS